MTSCTVFPGGAQLSSIGGDDDVVGQKRFFVRVADLASHLSHFLFSRTMQNKNFGPDTE